MKNVEEEVTFIRGQTYDKTDELRYGWRRYNSRQSAINSMSNIRCHRAATAS